MFFHVYCRGPGYLANPFFLGNFGYHYCGVCFALKLKVAENRYSSETSKVFLMKLTEQVIHPLLW